MKNSLLFLSLAGTVFCLLLLAQKHRQVEEVRARIQLAERRQSASARQLEQQTERLRRLQHAWQLTQSDLLREPMPASSAANTNAAPRDSASSLSAIFRDAAMREMLKDEAKVGAARNVDALLQSGLTQQLALTEAQSATLRELLLRKASLFWEQMLLPMMGGELDETTMKSAGWGLKASFEENTAQIRALLGEDGYTTYQWFEKTQSDRDHARRFSADFARTGQPLTEDQQKQLTDIMTTERANFRFSFDLADPSQLDFEHWYDNFAVDKLETYGTELEQLNDRVVQRSQEILSADQVNYLKSLLNRELQKGRLTMLTTTAALTPRMH